MNPLTNKQKSVLAQLAGKAYKSLVAVGCPVDDVTSWRREVQQEITGNASMREMTQRDYIPLLNHYNALAGKSQIKDNTYSDTAKAIRRLRDMMARHELTSAYLWAILQDQHRDRIAGHNIASMWDILNSKFTPEEIIHTSYTLNNRGRAKTAKIQRNNNLDGIPAEPYADPSSIPPQGISDHFNIHQI